MIAHLEHFEGTVLHAYYCAAGKLTIGNGHRIDFDPRFTKDSIITREQSRLLLLEDIAKYTEMAIRISRPGPDKPSVLASAAPRRLNAIIDFCFNCGGAAYASSALRSKVLAQDWPAAAYQNSRWDKVTDPKTKIQHVSEWQTQRRAATSLWLKEG
jgi:GH24 family phage-related lysozyme (muramidase)